MNESSLVCDTCKKELTVDSALDADWVKIVVVIRLRQIQPSIRTDFIHDTNLFSYCCSPFIFPFPFYRHTTQVFHERVQTRLTMTVTVSRSNKSFLAVC